MPSSLFLFFFFFNDTATTEIYTLSLHDALPISKRRRSIFQRSRLGSPSMIHSAIARPMPPAPAIPWAQNPAATKRSEEHTSELQSRLHLVCRLLLEKKKKKIITPSTKLETPDKQ